MTNDPNDPNDPMNTVSAIACELAHAITGQPPDRHGPVRETQESIASLRRRADAWRRSVQIKEALLRFAALIQPATVEPTRIPVEMSASADASVPLCLDQARGRAAIALREAGCADMADAILHNTVSTLSAITNQGLVVHLTPQHRNAMRALIRLAAIEQGDRLVPSTAQRLTK